MEGSELTVRVRFFAAAEEFAGRAEAVRSEADLCDRIFTVFSVGHEELETRQGKLGQELMRISQIGGEMTGSTMVLFNEPPDPVAHGHPREPSHISCTRPTMRGR